MKRIFRKINNLDIQTVSWSKFREIVTTNPSRNRFLGGLFSSEKVFVVIIAYLEKLESAYILHRCSRYDIQGKEFLKTQEKFYLADTALRYSVLGYKPTSVAAMLENVVYLELCRRGYTVHIGKTANGEIDFIAEKQGDKIYVQVTKEIKTEETEKREYDRLLEIRDNYPKYLLTTDNFAGGNYEGIKTMHIADFLLSDEF